MQLSKKQKTFSELVFAAFPKFTFNCKSFEKKITLILTYFRNY